MRVEQFQLRDAVERNLGVVVVLMGLLLYLPTVRVFFAQDDFFWLLVGSHLDARGLILAFADIKHGLVWRPLSQQAWFWFNFRLWGPSSEMFHLASLVFHLASSAVAFILARRLLGSRGWGATVGILYATNPVHFQAVAWPSAFTEVGSSFFLLVSFAAYLRFADSQFSSYGLLGASMVAFLASLMSKELAVMLPLVIMAHLITVGGFSLRAVVRRCWYLYVYLAAAGLYGMRFLMTGIPSTGAYAVTFNLLSIENAFRYIIWALGTTRYQLWLRVGMQAEPRLTIVAGATVGVVLVALSLYLWRRQPVVPFGACWFGLFLLPFLLVPKQVFPYYASLPSLGLALVAGALGVRIRSRLAYAAAGLLLVGAILGRAYAIQGEHVANPVPHMGRVARETLRGLERAGGLDGTGILYLVGVPDVERWAYSFQYMFMFYYPTIRRVTYVETREAIPSDAWIQHDVAIVYACRGRTARLRAPAADAPFDCASGR